MTLYFNRTEEKDPNKVEGQGPLEDGVHIMVVEEVLPPRESKSTPGKFQYKIIFRSIECGARVYYSIDCDADGIMLSGKDADGNFIGWKGQVKYNKLAEALGLPMGQASENDLVNGCVRALVKTRKGWQNIYDMWTPTEEEKDRAAEWIMEHQS